MFTWNLAAKMITCVVIVLILVIGTLSYIDIRHQSELLVEKTKRATAQLGNTIKASLEYSMIKNRPDEVQKIVQTISGYEDVERVMIFDKLGKIVASGDREEIGQLLSIEEESCQICHGGRTKPVDETVTFSTKTGPKVLRNVNPIRNSKECRSCHDPEREVLGVLVVDSSLADMEMEIASSRERRIILALVSFLSTGVVIAFLILVLVNRPIKRLLRTMSEVENGDLGARVDIETEDEVGRLAEGFNSMLERIDRADKERAQLHRKVEQFNEELQREIKLAVQGYAAANRELKEVNRRLEQTNKELKQAQRQLIQSEKLASVGQLAAGIAHEINNPLAGILNSIQILLEKMGKPLSESERSQALTRYLRTIEKESNRCKKIVGSLLDLSRQAELEKRPADINTILNETLLLLEHQLLTQKVKLTSDLAPQLPGIVADGSQLQQVFTNIILNAFEAMPRGGELKIRSTKGQGFVQVEIADTGCGIPEENISRIFDPFFTTKGSGDGTGLGLSVAYGIIDRHGGRIDVQSKVGEGTTFVIRLPECEVRVA